MSEFIDDFDRKFAHFIQNDVHRFTKVVIPRGDDDVTTDVFYDDNEELGEKMSVSVTEFLTKEGLHYGIQIPNCVIDVPEEMLMRIAVGVMRAREKINKRNLTNLS